MGYRTISMPDVNDLSALFKNSLLSDLELPHVTKLHNLLECGQAEAGECIRPRGEKNPALFVINSGHVQLRMAGSPVPVAELQRGEAFGLFSILFAGEATTDAYAVDRSTFIVLDGSTLRMLEMSSPQLALLILRSIRSHLSPIIYQALPVIGRSCLK